MRFEAMGDIILMTPALQALAEHFGAAIDVLVATRYSKVLTGLPFVGEIMTMDDSSSLLGYWRTIHELVRRRYDLVVDFHSSFRSWRWGLVPWLCRPARAIGYQRAWGWLTFDQVVPPRDYASHFVDSYEQLILLAGARMTDRRPTLAVTLDEQARARALLATHGVTLPSRLIGLYPGARLRYKCWPPDRFARVGSFVARQAGCDVIVLGGPGEQALVASVAALMDSKPAMAIAVEDLRLLFGLIKVCDLFVTNDTGPKHAAAGLGTNTIAIHGPADPRVWGPLADEYTVVVHKGLACRPCNNLSHCPRGDSACLTGLPAELVIAAVQERLGVTAGAPAGRAVLSNAHGGRGGDARVRLRPGTGNRPLPIGSNG